MKLKMKLLEGSEIKLSQDSILNFWAEKPYSTKIEYEAENGEKATIEVAHHALDIAKAVVA